MIFKWLMRPRWMCVWIGKYRNEMFSEEGKFLCDGPSFEEAEAYAKDYIDAARIFRSGDKVFFSIRPTTFFEWVFLRSSKAIARAD